MRKLYTAWSVLLTLAVAAQFFLAAMGAFDAAPKEEAFQPHRLLGYAILGGAALLVVLAAAARLPGRQIGMAGLVAGLVLLQPVIAMVANAFGEAAGTTSTIGKLIFGLHAVNSVFIVTVLDEAGKNPATTATPTPDPSGPTPDPVSSESSR